MKIKVGDDIKKSHDESSSSSSSSSYPVYSVLRKLRPGSREEGRTATTHTHKGEHGQRTPPTRER